MSRAKDVASLVVVISCLAAPQSLAQATVLDVEKERPDRALGGLAAPANLSFGAPLGSGSLQKGFFGEFALEGSTDDKTGIAAVSWKDAHNTFQFKATAPLSGGIATPFSLDGLSANSSVELSYSRIEFPTLDPLAADSLLDSIVARAKERCNSNPSHPLRIRSGKPASSSASECTNEAADIKYLTGLDWADARRILGLDKRIWFWGGGFTTARTTIDYLDEGTLAEQSVQKTSVSWSARAGVFTDYFGFVMGSYSYVKQFKPAGSAQNICQPLDGTDATVCADAVIGGPIETTRSVLKGEFRRFFAGGVAFAPSIQRDLKNDVTLVTLPVYFIKNKEGATTGGLRLTWRSDTEATTVSVFVGAALKPN
jgi:hypothetical protein